MMDTERRLAWQQIVEFTENVLSLARSQEWDAMLQMYRDRDDLLQTFFAKPIDQADSAEMGELIRSLMAHDQEIQALCMAAKDEAARELGKVNLGRKAEAAYSRFGG